ncbi:TPA: FAD-dependent oxidoreductase [Candidatus Dependentiae bacterium]|nr:MAG: BarJ [candidate division TM6 bacterium GW2011_GWE2_31_21]KKP54101.1 MAG: BarJ [candidate division TM6 bacterium GW2011_GWF2_33_332]HBS48317.1 FAD-dependent oxidoreductase [Candidatus Dependentiae bacterium]HBZ73009.1 FAD-dependent oxidoreductase [Candidatus Dependentiae bacterium]
MKAKKVVVIGAGPAGLTAGFEFSKFKNFEIVILEKDEAVGGLARTFDYKGYKFDIGPHHYITDSPKIEKWWKDLMEDDFIPLKRFTRIYYKNRFFNYPLEAMNVLKNLNFFECVACVGSYAKVKIAPKKDVKSFQDWVSNRFGKKLFGMFFKTYTEKVWGIKCEQISADWAAQRIKGLSLSNAIFYAFFGKWFKKNAPRTLQSSFYYPSLGSGSLWDRVRDKILQNQNSKIFCNSNVVEIAHQDGLIKKVGILDKSEESKIQFFEADEFLSSMPLQELIFALRPYAPQEVIEAASKLRYRGLITVNLVVNKKNVIPDHWMYIHDATVKMGRIGNMNNFSMKMSAREDHTAIDLEYFAFTDEEFWLKSDEELLEIGKRELEKINIVKYPEIIDGMVLRSNQAYPIYDENYQENLKIVLDYLSNFSNLHLMGRNGLHRYNNMDLAMESAIIIVDKILQKQNLNSKVVKNEKEIIVN